MEKNIKKAALLLFVSQMFLVAVPSYAQEQNGGDVERARVRYGIQLGLSENKVDIYSSQGGGMQPLGQGNSSFYAPGFSFAVLTDIRLGRCFSLRVMPGVTIIDSKWEPGTNVVPAGACKVESVLGELPVDIKFYPFRMGRQCPYLCSGLKYNYDFAALRKDDDPGRVSRLYTNDLRYVLGAGVDCDMRYLNIGVEMNVSWSLLSPGKGGCGSNNSFCFHNGPVFSLAFNIKA